MIDRASAVLKYLEMENAIRLKLLAGEIKVNEAEHEIRNAMQEFQYIQWEFKTYEAR